MALHIRRVNPLELRESILEFFWRMRAWPYATQDEYARYWQWRYTAISETDPAVWVALDDRVVVGHMACNFRRLACDGRAVSAGVPGNFLVDSAYRNTMIGPQLASCPIKLAKRGEIDLLLGYGNKVAHALFLGLGCVEIGAMLPFVEIRQWAPILARRLPGAAVLAPVASAVTRGLKGFRRRRSAPVALTVRDLGREDMAALDRSHWTKPAGLAWDGSLSYLAGRFLDCPVRSYRIIGVFDEGTGSA